MLDKELIKSILANNQDSYTQIIKSRYPDFYNEIVANYFGEKFGEKLFNYLHRNDPVPIGICKNCHTEKCKFVSIATGYRTYCSKRCSNQATTAVRSESQIEKNKETHHVYYESRECLKCGKSFEALKSRPQKYCSSTCSAESLIKTKPERIEKTKITKQEKYGDPNFVNVPKAKATNIKKYGVENVFAAKEVKEKIQNTNLQKYGNKIPVNSPELKLDAVKKFLCYSYNLNKDRYSDKFKFLFDQDAYKGVANIYKFRCKQCGADFEDDMATSGHPRCQICNPLNPSVSRGETEVVDYIRSIISEENIVLNDRAVLNGKELDIYIPSKNIAIEFDGLYWHSELRGKKEKNYHLNKTQQCLDKNIHLLHIFEDEWVDKNKIIKAKLLHLLGENNSEKPIYARKCEVREIENCSKFLIENHIQGTSPAPIKIGAFFENNLVAVMTLGKLRLALGNRNELVKQESKDTYELLRFATCARVTGIASKLLSYFVKTYKPKKIITFADRRYSVGNLYDSLGFKYLGATAPNYWYFKSGELKRLHRFNFRKQELPKKLEFFDPELTEWQNMQLNDYDRIWDCGNLKYEYVLS
jgi:hypothetical protein